MHEQCSVTLNKDSLPVQFFWFVSEDLMKMMVIETNRYAEQVIAESVVGPKSRMKRSAATTIMEMKKVPWTCFCIGFGKKAIYCRLLIH